MVAADLRPLGSGHYGKRGKAAVHPDEPARVLVEARWMAALRVKLGGPDSEADIPPGAVTATGDEQNPGQWRDLRLTSVGVDLVDRMEEPPKPAGVVVHADRTDLRQGDTAGMSLADPDHRGAAPVLLVAEPKAVAAAALALASGETNPLALVLAKLGPPVGRQGVAEVYRGLLKYLRRYVMPPG
jgi:hypothetical protein